MGLPCPTYKSQKSKVKSQKYIRGFTFIEVLVTIGLIVILTAIGVASYNNFNEKRVVKNAADQIRSNLRLVQRKALAGEKDCDSCGGTACDVSLVGWYASFPSVGPTPPAQMQIYGECGANTFGNKNIDFSSSLTLTLNIPGGGSQILFKPLRGGTNLTDEATITITGFVDKTETVYITTGGEIK